MVVQLIELGPFGCRINRGHVERIEEIPDGYKAVRVIPGVDIQLSTLNLKRNKDRYICRDCEVQFIYSIVAIKLCIIIYNRKGNFFSC